MVRIDSYSFSEYIYMPPNTNTPAAANATGPQAEFVPLPSNGRDPVFNLSRSFWYQAEADGLVRLTRIRRPGCIRGRVLLPIAAARAALLRLDTDRAPKAAA